MPHFGINLIVFFEFRLKQIVFVYEWNREPLGEPAANCRLPACRKTGNNNEERRS